MTDSLNEDSRLDGPADRLLEQSLREVLGGEQPPDLCERILNELHAAPQSHVTAISQQGSKKRWIVLATVACVLLVVGLTTPYLPRQLAFRESDDHGRELESTSAASGAGEHIDGEKDGFDAKLEQGRVNANTSTTPQGLTLSQSTPPASFATVPPQSETRPAAPIRFGEQSEQYSEVVPAPQTDSWYWRNEFWEKARTAGPTELLGNQASDLSNKRASQEAKQVWKGRATLPSPAASDDIGPSVTGASDAGAGRPTATVDLEPSQDNFERRSTREGTTLSDLDLEVSSTEGILLGVHVDSKHATALGERLRYKYPIEELRSPRFDPGQLGLGHGAAHRGDQYVRIHENRFIKTEGWQAVSTFSIDVDTASYTNVRQMLLQGGTLPPPDAVRIEELVNYFDYDYTGPAMDDEKPFASQIEVAGCPWNSEHRLVRIGLKGREMGNDKRPLSNIVFLVDVSGSMQDDNKLPLVIESLKYMTHELGENDRVAIVVYASAEGLALPSTRGDDQDAILRKLNSLSAGGSTAGGAGIQLAYRVAEDYFVKGGTNRVILCTDGDFNVGVTSTAELERLAEQKAKETGVFLTVLGFGRGNLNDAMMESISNKGNGNYHYIDNLREGRRVLVEQMSGTLVTIAKDVKIQVEFNPAQVASYRLIGYENRMLAREDFDDDSKDAGEIGAGHAVTALYEVVPAGVTTVRPGAEPLKYQPEFSQVNAKDDTAEASNARTGEIANAEVNKELLSLRIRYKPPTSDISTKIEFAVTDQGTTVAEASDDFKFAAAVGSFGMLLRGSQYRGDANLDSVLELATDGMGRDARGYRAEFLDLVKSAQALAGEGK